MGYKGRPRERRKRVLLALLDEYSDGVDQAAEEIGAFFDHLRQVGLRGLVAESLNDPEFRGSHPPNTLDADEPEHEEIGDSAVPEMPDP